MITNIESLDLNKTYTYADYLTWRIKERVELIKGRIFKMTPAPSTRHQRICSKIHGEFYTTLKRKPCEVFIAPFDVRFPKQITDGDEKTYTVVQPDICVICDPDKIDDRGCNGAPDIVVEILSPATSKKDLTDKFSLYEENLVKEYWVVYPGENVAEVFINTEGKYQPSKKYTINDTLQTSLLPELEIKLDDIFEDNV